MARITQYLTSISAQSPRSGPPPGRRLLAAVLCVLLVLASIAPGFAVAGEADSEGEGTSPPIEVPVSPPDFDPGGEEVGSEEEVPASVDEEETGAEVEIEAEAQVPEEVTGAAVEPPIEEAPPPPPTAAPESETPAAETVQQKEAKPSGPVANEEIVGPRHEPAARSTASPGAVPATALPAPPPQQEAPTSPQLVASPPADPGRNLGGKSSYVVQPGDCLWHIAAAVLPAGSDTQAIENKIEELWRMNENRIGTGDPNLIYPGTELRLR